MSRFKQPTDRLLYLTVISLTTKDLKKHRQGILSYHLASSLTIETISKNNGGGGNHGGNGTIKIMTNNTKDAKR